MKKLSFLAIGLISTFFLTAQTPGTLDLSYGDNGISAIDFGGTSNYVTSAGMQSDQKTVLAGYSFNTTADISFARLTQEGALDVGFGVEGIITYAFSGSEDYILDMVIQPDGFIVAVGYTCSGGECSMIVVRLSLIGLLDATFSNDGMVVVDFGPGVESFGESVALQDDGKILVAGQVLDLNNKIQCGLCRLNPDGTMDYSFGTNGVLIMDLLGYYNYINNVALQGDNIIVGGVSYGDDYDYLTIARFDPSGGLDGSFGVNGIVSIEVELDPVFLTSRGDMCLDAEGRILYGLYLEGIVQSDFALFRFLENGPPDNSFGDYGLTVTQLNGNSSIQYVCEQVDGKILAGGRLENDLAMVRYLENGDLDPSFGPDGNGVVVNEDLEKVRSLQFQDDGLIVAASDGFFNGGECDFAASRYYSGIDVGIEAFDINDLRLSIHPNPIYDHASIRFSLDHPARVKIELITAQGKTVAGLADHDYNPGDHHIRLDGSDLPNGLYILKVNTGGIIHTAKVLKK